MVATSRVQKVDCARDLLGRLSPSKSMTGLGDRVVTPWVLAFLTCLPSGSSRGSLAALLRLFRLAEGGLWPLTSEAPPSLARRDLLFLLFVLPSWLPRVLPLTESSASETL